MKQDNKTMWINSRRSSHGVVLIATLMVVMVLTTVVVTYLGFVQRSTVGTGAFISDRQALALAEAGIHKAIWNLKTPVGSGGEGESWTTSDTTESLGEGSYSMEVISWDWALAANHATVSASSNHNGHPAEDATDESAQTHWQSADEPTLMNPAEIVVAFPYALTLNKARFVVRSAQKKRRPKDYTWQVSSDGTNYITVVTVTDNGDIDVTNEFTAVPNVHYLKLHVTANGDSNQGVSVQSLQALGNKISSTGTVDSLTRTVTQTVAVDDATQMAYPQIDWDEI